MSEFLKDEFGPSARHTILEALRMASNLDSGLGPRRLTTGYVLLGFFYTGLPSSCRLENASHMTFEEMCVVVKRSGEHIGFIRELIHRATKLSKGYGETCAEHLIIGGIHNENSVMSQLVRGAGLTPLSVKQEMLAGISCRQLLGKTTS